MKRIFFIMSILLMSVSTISQTIFKVIEVKRSQQYGLQTKEDVGPSFFRIVLNDDTSVVSATYPFIFPAVIDTAKAVTELLKFKGDTRLCVFPVNNYNPARSQIFLGKNENYSLQVEALLIINQLLLEKPFNYASYPVLVNKKTNESCSISGQIIFDAFESYKDWYKKLNKHDTVTLKENGTMPLDKSKVRWY